MNYFELYGLPVSLQVDKALLKKKYYELSRKYHPDFFTMSQQDEQANALTLSSDVNKAFKTFQDDDELIRYVLTIKGLTEEEEKYNLNPAFLMEVMDINEELMELEFEPDEEKVKQVETAANILLSKIYSDVEPIIANYKEGVTSEKELLQVKDYYFRKKYLDRILDKIHQLRNIGGSGN
jgi:molecular chaperone HscB